MRICMQDKMIIPSHMPGGRRGIPEVEVTEHVCGCEVKLFIQGSSVH